METNKVIKNICLFVCLMLVYPDSASSQKFDTVKISVYYDAAGNASADFIVNQLAPAYEIIGDRIILQLVPYCLSAMLPGSENYRANAIHECAFCQTEDQKVQLDFAACIMNTSVIITEESVQQCATTTNLSYETMMTCAKGIEGRDHLANNGFATKAVYPPIYQLPAIAMNGWVNPAMQTKAKEDFLGYVCLYLENAPAGCAQN